MKRKLSIVVLLCLMVSLFTGCDLLDQLSSFLPTKSTESTQAAAPSETTAPTQAIVAPETTEPTQATVAPETTAPTQATVAPETTEPTQITPPPETTAPTQPDNSYILQISRADQSIFSEPSYDSQFVGVVELAGLYTIVEEYEDDEGNLWGRLKSGVGWVDVGQINDWNDYPGPISMNFADNTLLRSENYHLFEAVEPDDATTVAFRAYERLTNVALHTMDYDYETDTFAPVMICELPELTPEKPLVAQLFFGDVTEYIITFEDSHGNYYVYAIYISGRNGTLGYYPM